METVEELLPSATAAGMRICTTSVPCDFTNARFVVLEATFDAGSNLVTFAADFEQRSFDGSTYYGELRYNSAIPLTMDKPANASSPDAFAFPGAHRGAHRTAHRFEQHYRLRENVLRYRFPSVAANTA